MSNIKEKPTNDADFRATISSRYATTGSTLNRRPKLLFLAHRFPPVNASSCVRTWSIAKYLSRLGWEVNVVTPHPHVWRDCGSPEETEANLKLEGIQRILTGHRWRCLSPYQLNCWNQGVGWFVGGVCRKIARLCGIDSGIGWIKVAERACSSLTSDDVDIILATGSPFVAFRLARRLSDKLDCPYVLDYRDPWTGNPHAAHPTWPTSIREEARLLAGCAAVTIVSHSWGSALDSRFSLGQKLHIVSNGYDPEELADVQPYDFGHFAIVYTGTFYPPKRVISPVMAALKRLKETMNGKDVEWYFHYYGVHENHVREEAQRLGVIDRVVLHGRVPHAEALSAVRGAGTAVVITSVTEDSSLSDKGIVPGKVFETIGLGTPVLMLTPSGSDAGILAETTGSARIFTGGNIDGIASFLADAINGQAPEAKNPEVYEWTNIAKRLNAILRGVVNTKYKKKEALS